jgi:hypothetical protein
MEVESRTVITRSHEGGTGGRDGKRKVNRNRGAAGQEE